MAQAMERFMRDAVGTVEGYFHDAIDMIDKRYSPGKAASNLIVPALLALAMAQDCHSSTVFRGTEILSGQVDEVLMSLDALSTNHI